MNAKKLIIASLLISLVIASVLVPSSAKGPDPKKDKKAKVIPDKANKCTEDKPIFCKEQKKCVLNETLCFKDADKDKKTCNDKGHFICPGTFECKNSWAACRPKNMSCDSSTPSKCWDGSCAAAKGDCPPVPTCKKNEVRCLNSQCKNKCSAEDNKLNCTSTQKQCKNAAVCVDKNEDCPEIDGCPVGKSACDDGRCVTNSTMCDSDKKVKQEKCKGKGKKSTCWDGQCVDDDKKCRKNIFEGDEKKKHSPGKAKKAVELKDDEEGVSFPTGDGDKPAVYMKVGKKNFKNKSNVTITVDPVPLSKLELFKFKDGKKFADIGFARFVSPVVEIEVTESMDPNKPVEICLLCEPDTLTKVEDLCLAYVQNATWICDKAVSKVDGLCCGNTTHFSTWSVQIKAAGGNSTGNGTNPTAMPSGAPSQAPSGAPSQAPSGAPSQAPSGAPSQAPSGAPSQAPSKKPNDNEGKPQPIPDTKKGCTVEKPEWCPQVGKCFANQTECLSAKKKKGDECKNKKEVQCPGSDVCATTYNKCRGLAKTNCTKDEKKCWDGQCVAKTGGSCDPVPACPDGQIRCKNSMCKETCTSADEFFTCAIDEKPCNATGVCVGKSDDCPAFTGCTSGKYRCDDGSCKGNKKACDDAFTEKKKSKGCAKEMCFDAKCVDDLTKCKKNFFKDANRGKFMVAKAVKKLLLGAVKGSVNFLNADGDGSAVVMKLDKSLFGGKANITIDMAPFPESKLVSATIKGKKMTYEEFLAALNSMAISIESSDKPTGKIDLCLKGTFPADVTATDLKNKYCLAFASSTMEMGCVDGGITLDSTENVYCGETDHFSTWALVEGSGSNGGGVAALASSVLGVMIASLIALFAM